MSVCYGSDTLTLLSADVVGIWLLDWSLHADRRLGNKSQAKFLTSQGEMGFQGGISHLLSSSKQRLNFFWQQFPKKWNGLAILNLYCKVS